MKIARYQALRDRTLAAVDHVYAEPVSYIARKGKGQPKDTDRFSGEIEAVLRVEDRKDQSVSGSRDRNWRTNVHGSSPKLHIDPTRYPTLTVEIGDAIKAIARPGEPYFEVLAVDRTTMTRLVLHLGVSA